MVRILAWILGVVGLVLALGWGAGQILAQRAAALLGGGQAAAVRAAGFPARFGVEIDGLALPGWRVPKLTATAPLWTPLRWSLAPALPQEVTLGGLRFALSATAAQGGLDLAPGLSLPLTGATAHLEAPALTYEAAAAPSLRAQSLDVRLTRGAGTGYPFEAHVVGLALPPGLAASLTPEARLPDAIEDITLRGSLDFDSPLALIARPALTAITLEDSRLLWGGHALDAAGGLTVGADGLPEGVIQLSTRDWQAWLEFAIEGRLIDRQSEQMLRTMAGFLAAQSPDGSLELPLSFRRGLVSLGPVPLGPAPRLR